jgi:phosphatidylglycerophosphatase A
MLIATGGYSGHCSVVPATVGSFVGLLLYLPFGNSSPILHVVVIIVMLSLGLWAAGRAEDLIGIKDARPIVIDEFVGMWISLLLLPPRLGYVAGAFILFRIFDVLKPFPANHAQRLSHGWGIMLDDFIAALYANALLQLFRAVQ